jgi:predicted nucleic acid-binding protein
MTVVVDASLLVSLVANDPRADAVRERFIGWQASGEALHAPALTPYEVANGLTRLVAGGAVPAGHVEPAWEAVQELPIAYHPLRDAPPVIQRLAGWRGTAPTTPPT